MPNISFVIEDGKIVGRERLWNSVKIFFKTIKADGRYVWPMPGKEKRTRSIQQNRYYWSVICKLVSDHTGYTTEESHQIMAEMFLSYEKDSRTFVGSTTKLKTAGFEHYMESCRRWAATDLQIYIPEPNCPDQFYYSKL